MTPEQQSALEGVVGRALTQGDIDAIEPHLTGRNDVAIAALLSAGRTRANVREIGNGTILETVGLATGNALLDVLMSSAADSPFRHVRPLLEQGRLIVSSPLVAGTLASLVGTVLTQGQADALNALGRDPDPVSVSAVSDALNVAEGRTTL